MPISPKMLKCFIKTPLLPRWEIRLMHVSVHDRAAPTLQSGHRPGASHIWGKLQLFRNWNIKFVEDPNGCFLGGLVPPNSTNSRATDFGDSDKYATMINNKSREK